MRGNGINKVLFGSTNFSWRGFYVQSNNAVVVNSKKAVAEYFQAFDSYFSASEPGLSEVARRRQLAQAGRDGPDGERRIFSAHNEERITGRGR